MVHDPIYDVKGTRRGRVEIDRELCRLRAIAAGTDTYRTLMAQGALDAARWSMGQTTTTPTLGAELDPYGVQRMIRLPNTQYEADAADMVATGRTGAGREERIRATGILGWLNWWNSKFSTVDPPYFVQ